MPRFPKISTGFVFLVVLLLTGNLYPQQSFAQDSTRTETGASVRMPSPERLAEISRDERYNYHEETAELTPWQRFILWLQKILGDWITTDFMQMFLKVTAGIFFALVLLLLINQIMKGQIKSAVSRRKDRTLLDLNFGKVIESEANLDKLLKEAIEKKKYGLAVRYLYQLSLVMLKDLELIKWKPDKTNHEYLLEMEGHPAASSFDRLTYFHDYVDYGDFEIDEQGFKTVSQVFEEFKKAAGKTL